MRTQFHQSSRAFAKPSFLLSVSFLAVVAGCSSASSSHGSDAGRDGAARDSGAISNDTGQDSTASSLDSGIPDTSVLDSDAADTGTVDTGVVADTSVPDNEAADTGTADTGVVADSGGGRNVLLQPFSTYSPWNMPLGTGTTFEAVGLGTAGKPAIPNSTYDDNNIMVFTPTAPSTIVAYNSAGWTGGNRCDFNSYPLTNSSDYVPLPSNFLLLDSAPADTENNQIAVLEADGQTIFETAAGQRCSAGGPLVGTDQFGFGTTTINLYTDGAAGLHGALAIGSNVGGTIRLGEIMPGSGSPIDGIAQTMNHGLEFEGNGLFSQTNYWATHNIGGTYVPPATNGDGGNEGILIALLPTFNFNGLQTPPARSIAWTLMHFGAWVIDNPGWSATGFVWEESSFDTANGTQQCAALGGELGNNGLPLFPGCNGNNQFYSNWGYYVTCDQCNDPWEQDIAVILANLQVVTNYDLSTFPIAKLPPGTLLAPLLPPVTPP
jgi:hypothetical protein